VWLRGLIERHKAQGTRHKAHLSAVALQPSLKLQLLQGEGGRHKKERKAGLENPKVIHL